MASSESKCPRTQTGCCFLLDSGVISIGFNGKEPGGPNEWEWKLDGDPEVIHAEEQCIRKLLAEGLSAKNATVYVTLSPCLSCAKLLVGAKVKRVVYLNQYRKTEGIEYLQRYGVAVEQYQEKEPEHNHALSTDFNIFPLLSKYTQRSSSFKYPRSFQTTQLCTNC